LPRQAKTIVVKLYNKSFKKPFFFKNIPIKKTFGNTKLLE